MVILTACLLVLLSSVGRTYAVASPRGWAGAPSPVTVTPAVSASFLAPAPPELSARAAYVLDATVGTELYALNADERRAPASLTKVATALVVLDRADLDDTVAVEPADIGDDSESRVGLEPGDELTVEDLLVGLLVPSGNDAARALARHVGASLPDAADPSTAFVADMNGLAERLGLENTRFANPTGLDQDDHYSSARDLATLAAVAMADPTFAEIVARPNATLGSRLRPDGYFVSTTNALLADGLVQGVKTGTTGEAGGCLISAIRVGENRVITVVLGSPVETDADGRTESPARYADTRAILDALPNDYRWLDPGGSGEVDGLADELAVWRAALPTGPAIVLPADRFDELRYRLVLGPPAEPDATIGRVLFFVGTDLLTERPVVQAA